ncbi:MAG: hypothetical protein ACYC23_21685, partial [Limisphaerales bacterium]
MLATDGTDFTDKKKFSSFLYIGAIRDIRGAKPLFGFWIGDFGFGDPAVEPPLPGPLPPATGGDREKTDTLICGPRPVLRSQRAARRKDVEHCAPPFPF